MAPIKLVYSSDPADEALREKLSSHLSALVREKVLVEWHEQLIPAGADVAAERRRAWYSADLLLLLLSADYLASEVCEDEELRSALERQQRGQLLVLPILLRPCDWQATFLSHVQPLPRNGVPVTAWENQDAALLTVAQEIRGVITAQSVLQMTLSPLQRVNRRRLLKRVRATWIDGFLEQSLQHAVWVDLHLQKQLDALENPWRLVVQELAQRPRPLPAGTSIVQVLDEADEELLILGEAGSGKTTLLLYLARTLLERAESDERRRIPVIFFLSSWAQQRLPLERWLVEELKTKYQVPEQIGRAWVEVGQIFPLLDGLDEVEEAARPACVQALSVYAQRPSERLPLVICCRDDAYQALTDQFPLQYAVMLLPFTDDQIDVYLSSVSGQLDVLRQTLRKDRELFELARKPLMLAVFTLAYHESDAPQTLVAEKRADYPQALFRYYVKYMLTRRAPLRSGTEEQARRWLGYLARQLRTQQQTLFAVEYLQPAWLPERARAWYRWSMPLVYALTFGGLFGPIFGLAFAGVYGLIYRTFSRLIFGLFFGLIIGLAGGLIGGLIFGLAFRHNQSIQPAEATLWSWSEARRGLRIGALGGLLFALVGALVGGLVEGWPGAVAVGLSVECLVVLVGTLVGGLAPVQLAERVVLRPNEGIWRSGRRGLLVVLFFILIFGLVSGLVVGLVGKSIATLIYALIFGLVLGAMGGLVFGLAFGLVGGRTGLAAFLQHFTLRLFLWRLRLLPWRLVPFLDEAAERLLLRRAGGSYLFVHSLLRDVLAEREETKD